MNKIIELKNILQDENNLYQSILDIANKKTVAISSDKIDEIQQITKQEEEYIQQVKLLEYKREDKITEIERELGIEKLSDITTLINHISDENLKRELTNTKDKLTNTLKQLKSINDLNNTLIKDALEYISLNLNLLTSATSEATYGSKGGELETQNRNFFDIKG